MVNKYSLDEKLKERENVDILSRLEDSRRFVKYFVNLMEDILNYNYDFSSYFEVDKTKVEIRLVEKQYENDHSFDRRNCWISACVRLCSEDYSYPKLKVVELKIADTFFNYIMDIDHFFNCSADDTDCLQMIQSRIFKDFKYDWSYNKNKAFTHTIKNKNITPSQYIIDCINNYIYDDIIKPKSKTMTRDEFLNSEFKCDVDKKTQQIFNRYFFENI